MIPRICIQCSPDGLSEILTKSEILQAVNDKTNIGSNTRPHLQYHNSIK